ncbi:MAG TPA: MFS transporter [Thermoleophilaceae bacterium]|nr:MFS transporter [Thermoleophilaceae bacterium]
MDPALRKRLTLVACILGSTVVFVDTTVVNVALPALSEDFGASLAEQQWVVEAYLLTLGALILIGGSLADLFGRRRVFTAGLAAFGVTSLLCAVAPSVGLLVAARALQGVAGALLVPASLAIIRSTFPEAERGAAVGSWTAWTGIGIVIGPLLGGLLVDLVSWRLVFALNLPLVVVTIALVGRCVEESRDAEASGRVDVSGALLGAAALGGIVVALLEQPTRGFDAPAVWMPLAGGTLAAVGFIVRERTAAAPMLPLSLFRERDFSAANLATLAVYAALGGVSFFSTLFIQQVAGYSAFEAGAAFMPITLLLFLLSRRFGALADRLGPRLMMAAGPLVAAGGSLLLLRVGSDAPYAETVLPAVVVFGLGLAMTVAPLTATVLNSVPERRAGVASGVNNAVARIAGLVAIAAVGAVVAGAFGADLDERLAGARLTAGQEERVAEARESPLASAREGDLPELIDAAVEGYRAGMLACALLLVAGAAISALGVRSRRGAIA